jgi:hypothetical protein
MLEETMEVQELSLEKALIRCSSLGCLFTEPVSKEDKLAGRLSKTAKSHLAKVYIELLWGKRKDITTKQMDKGTLCQPEAIAMTSELFGFPYEQNTERKSDDYITGEADIVVGEGIIDIKCSWDAETFIANLTEPANKDYLYQMQGYMRLWNKPTAIIRYCLVSAPTKILKDELSKLLYRMDVATDVSPEYIEAAAELNFNMTFDEIPIEHRVIDIIIPRNEEIIAQIPEKVEKAREYLKELHEKHMSLNLKPQLI